ncbi:hypothetical protein F5B22DRAFT_302905 [Xylaria bambusicola]|uniref:uncharacterized protein n=1 Tax=Xylaria bambusicola TaxID=326684 RepID=UPI00200798FF|nr:uncharacterized protein F5B22DRAFT_302905 [Xylaria bambusicola]KAI0512450.1 hypothetical protein F5B22DRAFT_302905 [Xylaria bambusicola]
MDLSQRAVEEVVHPTAAFLRASGGASRLYSENAPQPSWNNSLLNPKNRIDSLEIPGSPLWRVDGCTGLGTQYYAVPICLPNVPPMRMDVFIPENQPAHIREQLDLHKAFHTKDAVRLSRLAITKHIVRTLQAWTESTFEDIHAFERFYKSKPFGSRLVFENLSLDIRQINVRLGPNHNLELQLLSLQSLNSLWGTMLQSLQVVDFFDVHVVSVLHDSVCLVRIQEQLFIFKALVSETKYLYHELKTLCTVEPHANIISRPIHLVRKPCSFGGKHAIVGFTTFYHQHGSLRDLLPQLRIHGRLRLEDQFKWSIQVIRALEHLRVRSSTYYPDLRLDNLVLSKGFDIVMVDFEQRGVWCEFAAPEVNAIEYIRLIAADDRIPSEVSLKYQGIMRDLVPDYDVLQEDRYTNPQDGYNASWIALSPEEQELAEVYMVGRLLWCIFEGVSGPQKAAVWQSYRWESNLEFPEYDRTPPALRELIDRCTRGRRPNLGSVIIRQRSHLLLRHRTGEDHDAEQVQDAATAHWVAELKWAEEFLVDRSRLREQGIWNNNYYKRPRLVEVLEALLDIQRQYASTS